MQREKAAIGALLTLEKPTRDMRREAATGGFYESPIWKKRYPRLQILTVAELLEGKEVENPPSRQVNVTFRKAKKGTGRKRKRVTPPLPFGT